LGLDLRLVFVAIRKANFHVGLGGIMGMEIERKFLVCGDDWRQGSVALFCRQGYLLSKIECTIRVRVSGDQGFLTVKGQSVGLARPEYEYAIPLSDAQAMLDGMCARPLVEKVRHTLTFAGTTWEIDEFLNENQGLIVAEVELVSPEQAIELPPWIDREVSNDPRYLNVNLATHPFSRWATAG
jgi:CYTH domain-containing protein